MFLQKEVMQCQRSVFINSPVLSLDSLESIFGCTKTTVTKTRRVKGAKKRGEKQGIYSLGWRFPTKHLNQMTEGRLWRKFWLESWRETEVARGWRSDKIALHSIFARESCSLSLLYLLKKYYIRDPSTILTTVCACHSFLFTVCTIMKKL